MSLTWRPSRGNFAAAYDLTLSTIGPSPEGQPDGDKGGHGASPHDEAAKRGAQKASAVAKQRIAKKGKGPSGKPNNGGWIANTFGTNNQLYNILAIVVATFLALLIIALIGTLWLNKLDAFLDLSKPMIAILASIIAFIAGRGTRPN